VSQPSRKTCWVVDLGLAPYVEASELQARVVAARKRGDVPDVLLLCEHPHVITLGRNGKREHLKAGERILAQMNVEFHTTDRGGDITYHGPGQIVGYPILDLAAHKKDVRWYVEQLEEAMIRASADFGITARRFEDKHGIWVDTERGEEKLAALGVHLSRWVTSHGFAYNASTSLNYFDLIVPCGISGKRATSLERLLNRAVSRIEVTSALTSHFGEVFDSSIMPIAREEFLAALATSESNIAARAEGIDVAASHELELAVSASKGSEA
jgi:lipoate-protein ligase B